MGCWSRQGPISEARRPSFYQRQNYTFSETNYNAVLNFDKNVGSNFHVNALVGTNVLRDNISTILASPNGGLVLPGYWAVSNSVNTPAAPS